LKAFLAQHANGVLGFVRPRRLLAEVAQIAGFAAIVVGVDLIAGQGYAWIVGGLLVVLLAFEADR
jgi:hypothetical protein